MKGVEHKGMYNYDLEEKLIRYNIIRMAMDPSDKKEWNDRFSEGYTYDTNAIEGNTLYPEEVHMILVGNTVPPHTGVTVSEIMEIIGHDNAWKYVQENVKKKVQLTENIIKDIHVYVLPVIGCGGIYRNVRAFIRESRFLPPSHDKIHELMKFLEYDILHKEFADPVEKAAWVHAEFVKIHPFMDGNGRTARLLMNYILMENCYPPVNIKKENAASYFTALDLYFRQDTIEPLVGILEDYIHMELDAFLNEYDTERKGNGDYIRKFDIFAEADE